MNASTVIKLGEQNPALVKRLETLNVADHVAEARKVVESARERAAEILSRARREGAEIRRRAAEQGFDRGFRQGYEAGEKAGADAAFQKAREEFAERHAHLAKALAEALSGFDSTKEDLLIRAERDTCTFAVRVAERVTGQVGLASRDAAVQNVKAALRSVQSATQLEIRVNPLDAATLERFADQLAEQVKAATHVSVVPDPAVSPGGCVLTTPETTVDATLEIQLAQIAELVAPAVEPSP
jgi:flagellar biosynthesis/type III secretory pathway protein FliH